MQDLESLWAKYSSILRTYFTVDEMLDCLGERIVEAPCSVFADSEFAKPGGFLTYSLKVLSTLSKLANAYELDVPKSDLVALGLLHGLGHVGDLERAQYLIQDSKWHRENTGKIYKLNPEIQRMTTEHRTLFLLQHFGLAISRNTWLAISLQQGRASEDTRFYSSDLPIEAMILAQAIEAVRVKDRNSSKIPS